VPIDPRQIEEALEGDLRTMQALIRRLLPVIRAEVNQTLSRDMRSEFRDAHQEVQDFVQEVVLTLIVDDGKVLRCWDPQRGRTLESFVRLVARRRVNAILRSGRGNPWADEPMAGEDLEHHASDDSALSKRVESTDTLARVLDRLDERLDTRGKQLFRMLYVEERSIEEVAESTAMTREAVYSWRCRFRKIAAGMRRSCVGAAMLVSSRGA
jgi:RNA polymerase sigma-70 factor (ECF subfamily)